jgi:hypothetical protein
MPFGLNNATSTYQRTMEIALQGLQWETCPIYIDDVIVFGTDIDDHNNKVDKVLQKLDEAGLKLKPEKCEVLQKEVTFLGHVVSGEAVRLNPMNKENIINWPRPKNARNVKQFVALGIYNRKFVENFAKRARPIVELTKKGKKF